MSDAYKKAGVDVEAGYEAVRLIKEHVAKTVTPGVLSGIGGFGGLFSLDPDDPDAPVLVSGTDGVGTKLKLAFLMDRHDTVGQDCVAMCVNDIVCCGAKPLFFLDYVAVGKNYPEKIAQIVKGVADGCVLAGAALIGGETAEMPGFYPEDEYDLAGFSVGVAERSRIIDGSRLKAGDQLIGLRSSGVHSNGFSLVRKLFDLDANGKETLSEFHEELGETLGEALLRPTRIYVKPVLSLAEQCDVRAVSHITGGGFIENVPRMLPPDKKAMIYKEALPKVPIFEYIKRRSGLSDPELYNTFNMGIGMIIAVPEAEAERAVEVLRAEGEEAYRIGEIVSDQNGVELC